MMKERFQVEDPRALLAKVETTNLIRLMMALDAMRSVYRWIEHAHKTIEETGSSDLLMALVTASGWSWETVKLLREGKKDGWLRANMIDPNSECRRLWNEISDYKNSERLKRIMLVRHHCFGHFDKSVAEGFRTSQLSEIEILPFLETTGHGKFLLTRYPWAYAASAAYWLMSPYDDGEARRRIRETCDLVLEITGLVNHLMPNAFRRLGVKLIPMGAEET